MINLLLGLLVMAICLLLQSSLMVMAGVEVLPRFGPASSLRFLRRDRLRSSLCS